MKNMWIKGFLVTALVIGVSFAVYYVYNYSYYHQVCTEADANAKIPEARQLIFDSVSKPTPDGVVSEWNPTISEAKSWKAEDFIFVEFRNVEGTVFEMRFKRNDRPNVYYDIGFFSNCGFGISLRHVGDGG